MYEPYPFDLTVTQIDELGGADEPITLTLHPVICDRCGRRFPKDKLTWQNGWMLCEECLDENQEETE